MWWAQRLYTYKTLGNDYLVRAKQMLVGIFQLQSDQARATTGRLESKALHLTPIPLAFFHASLVDSSSSKLTPIF